MNIPAPEDEIRIQQALYDLNVSGNAGNPDFENIIRLACETFDVPIALISYIVNDKLYITSKSDFRSVEIEREKSFCSHAIMSDEVFVVEDAQFDDRFCYNPYVVERKYRFYAGAPLIVEEGVRIGTICLMGFEPRKFSQKEARILKQLSNQVVSFLKLHKTAQVASEQATSLEEAMTIVRRSDIMIDIMRDGVVVMNKNGQVITANPSACRILGMTYGELLEAKAPHFGWIMTNENGKMIRWRDHPAMIALSTGEPVFEAVVGVRKLKNEKLWLQVSAQPFCVDGEDELNEVVVSFTDISSTKNQEAKLRQLSQNAEAANKAKTAFLANMSHEIRTPLNGVVGIAGALARTNLDERQKDMVELIVSSGKTLEKLLNDILDLSKVEAGQIELESAPFNIEQTIESAAKLLKIRAEEKGVSFDIDFDENLKSYYLGDSIRLRQIVSNLSSNAVKFTDSGSVKISIKPTETANGIIVKVSDTGIGMTPEACALIFNRFTQADTTITRRFGGTGLGLAISKGLVELMGGNIKVSSEPNVGTTFELFLPIQEAEELQNNQSLHEENLATLTNDDEIRPSILLVEDHLMNQKVFSIMIEPFNMDVTIANNGAEAVEIYQQSNFDIVFMDMQMPIMDGVSATRKIREIEAEFNRSHTPIVMLTANATISHQQKALAAGADYHVIKPLTLESLGQVLIEALSDDNENIAKSA